MILPLTHLVDPIAKAQTLVSSGQLELATHKGK